MSPLQAQLNRNHRHTIWLKWMRSVCHSPVIVIYFIFFVMFASFILVCFGQYSAEFQIYYRRGERVDFEHAVLVFSSSFIYVLLLLLLILWVLLVFIIFNFMGDRCNEHSRDGYLSIYFLKKCFLGAMHAEFLLCFCR